MIEPENILKGRMVESLIEKLIKNKITKRFRLLYKKSY